MKNRTKVLIGAILATASVSILVIPFFNGVDVWKHTGLAFWSGMGMGAGLALVLTTDW